MKLTLYTTSHCHLCEQAETMLTSVSAKYDIQWLAHEIAYDENLLDLYGTKIPVIKRQDNNAEISWPFSAEAIITLINTIPQ